MDSVDVARGKPRRARQPHEQRVQVGTLAAQVAGLEHCADVPDPTAPHLRIAEGVVDDPLVDRAGLLHVGVDALGDLLGGLLHDAVGAHELRGLAIPREGGPILGRRIGPGPGHVHVAIAGREPGRHLDRGRALAGRPLRVEDPRPVALVPVDAGDRPVAGPALPEALEVVGVGLERERQPHPRGAGGVRHLRTRDDLEGAPLDLVRLGRRRASRPVPSADGGGRRHAHPRLQKDPSLHEYPLVDRMGCVTAMVPGRVETSNSLCRCADRPP